MARPETPAEERQRLEHKSRRWTTGRGIHDKTDINYYEHRDTGECNITDLRRRTTAADLLRSIFKKKPGGRQT